jgi:gluconokinase
VRIVFGALEWRERRLKIHSVAQFALRSPSEKVGGLFHFGRMLDKIRLYAKGELPSDYHVNLGKGFDEKCVKFLRVDYDKVVERVRNGGTDQEILDWCFTAGRQPSEDDIYVWNEFMRKRGWNDEVSEIVDRRKTEAGMTDRSDIQTSFQFIDADEGRLPKPG